MKCPFPEAVITVGDADSAELPAAVLLTVPSIHQQGKVVFRTRSCLKYRHKSLWASWG